MLKSKIRKLLTPILAVLLGFSLGFLFRGHILKETRPRAIEIRQRGWNYINPLLECEQAQNAMEDNELKPFEEKVEDFVTGELHKKWGDQVSVYFRELNNGLAFTIGKTEFYYPASLLKVPEMIAILKEASERPGLLSKKIVYNNLRLKSAQNTDVVDRLVFGRSYTIEELLRRMIEYSDNVSLLLLEHAITPPVIRKVYDDLGILAPQSLDDQSTYMISSELYSSFFRILYNASYLNKEMSEKALEYLSKTTFNYGIVAGVPPDTKVAHKFGIRHTPTGIKYLHDCGIVYYPNHPYLLCVMTSGPLPEYLDHTIADISHFIYKEIDRQHGIY